MFSKEKITIAYTIEQCEKCQSIRKRKFSNGDVLFAPSSKCSSCDGQTFIEKIFGEALES